MKTFYYVLAAAVIVVIAVFLVTEVGHHGAPQTSPSGGSGTGMSPASSTQPVATVPAQYQSLYNSMESALAQYNKDISGWDGSTYPVNYATELKSADSQKGTSVLKLGMAPVNQELDADKNLGVQAVMVEIGFPLFDQNFYTFIGQSPTLAQQFITYYASVAQAIHSRGMKMIVEANFIYSNGDFSDLKTANYYQSLTYQQFVSRRSASNVIIAQQIKPDYFILQSEPKTEVAQINNPAIASQISNPVTDAQMVSRFVTDLDNANIPGLHSAIKLGAGMGAWQPHWQEYLSGFEGIAGLDSIDCHIYFVGDPSSSDEISIAMQIADGAHAAGKGASIAEFWPHKETTPSDASAAISGVSISGVRALDVFSFWSPYDQQFLLMMMQLANYKHLDYLSSFAGLGDLNWAYLDYGSAPCTNLTTVACDSQIQTAVKNLAEQAIANLQLSPTGAAYKSYIVNVTLSTVPQALR